MSSIHRQVVCRRAGAWRTMVVVAALCAATLLPSGAGAQDATDPPGVRLTGPTGAQPGVPVAAGVPPDATAIAPLDTFGRDPELGITGGGRGWVSWVVTAVPVTDIAATPVPLATGVAEVPLELLDLVAPPPGDWQITGDLVAGEEGVGGTFAWHLVIPDRSLPDRMPAPDLVLFGGGGTVITERGSVCYVGDCADIGAIPPAGRLPLVRLDRADEPIALTLSDGSGMVEVQVTATLLDVDETRPVMLLEGPQPIGTTVVLVPPPPSGGRWLLDVFVRFSDARGDQTGYARVSVPRG